MQTVAKALKLELQMDFLQIFFLGFTITAVTTSSSLTCSREEEEILKDLSEGTTIVVDFCSEQDGVEYLFKYFNYSEHPRIPFIMNTKFFSGLRSCGFRNYYIFMNSSKKPFVLSGCEMNLNIRRVYSIVDRLTNNYKTGLEFCQKQKKMFANGSNCGSFADFCIPNKKSFTFIFYAIFVTYCIVYILFGWTFNIMQEQQQK